MKRHYESEENESNKRSRIEVDPFIIQYFNQILNNHPLAAGHGITAALIISNIEVLEFLVQNGANVNEANPAGIYPLLFAIQEGKVHLIKWLLSHSANANQTDEKGWYPLQYAAALSKKSLKNSYNIIKLLIDANANPAVLLDNPQVLISAINNFIKSSDSDYDYVKLLLGVVGNNIYLNKEFHFPLFNYAIERKDQSILQTLKEQDYKLIESKPDNLPPYLHKIDEGNVEIASLLISLGTPPGNIYDWLTELLSNNKIELADKLFIDNNTDLLNCFKACNDNHQIPILQKIIMMNEECVTGQTWLLKNSYQLRPTEWKSITNYKIAELLIEQGFNINDQVENGISGLCILRKEGKIKELGSWVANGVDISALLTLKPNDNKLHFIDFLDKFIIDPLNFNNLSLEEFNKHISANASFLPSGIGVTTHRCQNILLKEGMAANYGDYMKCFRDLVKSNPHPFFNFLVVTLREYQNKCEYDEAILLNALTGISPMPLSELLELSKGTLVKAEMDEVMLKTLDFYAQHPKCTQLIQKFKDGSIDEKETNSLIHILKSHTGEYLAYATDLFNGPELTLKLLEKNAISALDKELISYAMPKAYKAKLKAVLEEVQSVKENPLFQCVLDNYIKLKEEVDILKANLKTTESIEEILSLNEFEVADQSADTNLVGSISVNEDLG